MIMTGDAALICLTGSVPDFSAKGGLQTASCGALVGARTRGRRLEGRGQVSSRVRRSLKGAEGTG